MIRKKRTVKNLPRVLDDEIPEPPPLLTTESDEDDETLEAILQQHGTRGVQLKVYKIDESGSDVYCHTFQDPPGDFHLEEAVKKLGYGAGGYRVKVHISGVFRAVIPIAYAEKQQVNNSGPVAPVIDPTIQLLKEQMARQENLINQLLLRRSESGGEREPISQVVDAVAKMQNMGGGMSADAVIKILELGRSLAGNGGGESDSLTSIIKEAIPAVLPALMAGRALPQNPNGLQANPPMRTVTPGTIPEGSQDVTIIETAMLKAGIAFLKKKCMGGSDPMLYVHLIADNADDPKYQKLLSSVLNDDFSTFVSHDAEIGKEPFEKFFRAIYDGLRSAFGPDDSMADDTGGEGGDHANIARDVSPRKERGNE